MCVLYCVGIEYCIFIICKSSYQSTTIKVILTGPVPLYDGCENYPAYKGLYIYSTNHVYIHRFAILRLRLKHKTHLAFRVLNVFYD